MQSLPPLKTEHHGVTRMALSTKIIIAVVGLAVVGTIVARNDSQNGGGGPGSYTAPRSAAPRSDRGSPDDRLAMLQRQHDEIMAQVQPCLVQLQAALDEQAAGAINGEFVRHDPPCAQYMPQWQATLALLEKEIYQAQTGQDLPVRDFSGLPPPSP